MPPKGKGAVGKTGSKKPTLEQKNMNRNKRPTGLKAIQSRNRAMSAASEAGAEYQRKRGDEFVKAVKKNKKIATPAYGGAGAGESMYSDRARRFFGAMGEINKALKKK